MKNKKSKLLGIILTSAVLAMLPLFFARAEYQITETRITTDEDEQNNSAIYENSIVWGDNRNGNYDIYMNNLETAEETQITTNGMSQGDAVIFGDNIVWNDNRNGNWDIYTYNIVTENETRLTSNTTREVQSDIYGDIIVWMDNRNGNEDIYMYNLATEEETQITNNTSDQRYPEIYENNIVWQDSRNGNDDIYMYDIETEEEIQITDNIEYQEIPDIYGDKIVWVDLRNGNPDIYMYDLETEEEIQITTDENEQYYPRIYGNKIVWEDYRNDDGDNNTDMYMYDIETEEETQITTDESEQYEPAIYGNRIIWTDNRNGESDIYMAELTNNPRAESFFPEDEETNVLITSNLLVTFDREVYAGEGNIEIKKASDDSIVESIDIQSERIIGWGTSTITINPQNDLPYTTRLYITIDDTAIKDNEDNFYAGIDNNETWNFTTQTDGIHFQYRETFETEEYKDEESTTGNWNTEEGLAELESLISSIGEWQNISSDNIGAENITENFIIPSVVSSVSAVDFYGNPIIVFSYNGGLYFSRWNGENWAYANGIDSGLENFYSVIGITPEDIFIQVDSNDNIYVSWVENDDEMKIIRWNGESWTYPDGVTLGAETISDNTRGIKDLKLDENELPVITYYHYESLYVDRCYLLRWNGSAWTGLDKETESPNDFGYGQPHFVIKENGFIDFVMKSNEDDIIFSEWNGDMFTYADGITEGWEMISNNSYFNSQPNFVLDQNGNPLVMWQMHDASHWPWPNYVGFTRWNGTDWTMADNISIGEDSISGEAGDFADIRMPKVIVDHENSPTLFWHNGESLYSIHWNGFEWTYLDGETVGYEIVVAPSNFDRGYDVLFNDDKGDYYILWDNSYGYGGSTHFIMWNGEAWTNADGETLGDENISGNYRTDDANLMISQNSSIMYAFFFNLGEDDIYGARLGISDVYNDSDIFQSININETEDNIEFATLSSDDSTPGDSRIEYFLSNDGGSTWQEVQKGEELTFPTLGNDLRWKAILYRGSVPIIESLQVDYSIENNFPTPTPTPTPETTPTPIPEITPTPTPTPEVTPIPTPENTPTPTPIPEDEEEVIIPKIKSIQESCSSIKLTLETDKQYKKEKLDIKVKYKNIQTKNEDTLEFKNQKADKDGNITLTISTIKESSHYEIKTKFKDDNKEYSAWSKKKEATTKKCQTNPSNTALIPTPIAKLAQEEQKKELQNKSNNKDEDIDQEESKDKDKQETKQEKTTILEKKSNQEKTKPAGILNTLIYGISNVGKLISENKVKSLLWLLLLLLIILIIWGWRELTKKEGRKKH